MGIFGAGTDSLGIRPVGLVNRVSLTMNDIDGTEERTRTSTGLPPLAPEASASTNSATSAKSVTCRARAALTGPRTLTIEPKVVNRRQSELAVSDSEMNELTPSVPTLQ